MTSQLEAIGSNAPTHNVTPADLLDKAVSQNADLDKLEKLMELQERWEKNEARKAYHAAMSRFKADPPKINKDKLVDFQTSKGRTSYHHATLASVTTAINSALSKHGLTASWETDQKDRLITVTCRITHELGHSESTSLSSAPDESGGKNSIQAIGSAVTYLQRYTLLALTGLATHDQDADGATPPPVITPQQVADLRALMKEVKGDEKAFLKYFKVDTLDDLPADQHQRAVSMLESKRVK